MSEVTKTLNEDLTSANEEIQYLRSHSVQLEHLVLKKQETIEILERQLESSINSKNGSLKSKILSRSDKHQSMPATFNTPTGTSSIKPDNRGWSSEINEIETFSTLVRNKKTNRNMLYSLTNKNIANVNETNFLKIQNWFEVLSDVDSNINEIKSVNKMLICSDSQGRGLAWKINHNKIN